MLFYASSAIIIHRYNNLKRKKIKYLSLRYRQGDNRDAIKTEEGLTGHVNEKVRKLSTLLHCNPETRENVTLQHYIPRDAM